MRPKGPRSVKLPSPAEAEALIRRMRGEAESNENYRTKSLRIHGPVCARCGRVFDAASLHQLTVHHRDGNHQNNPPDGSNWENLCVHCHEDEHSRGLLGEYLANPE